MRSGVRIVPLREKHLPFAMELKNIAGWNQTEDDWRRYLDLEPDGCFLAEAEGEAAGTATVIRYGDRFAWIGMVLVHPAKRGLGIGTRLLRTAIDYLHAHGVACIKLDATPMGKKVYVPLGFAEEYDVLRYEKTAGHGAVSTAVEQTLGESISQINAADLNEIALFDARCFGANRLPVLRALWSRNEEYAFCSRDADGITGYMMAHEGYDAVQIGPWAAGDAETAEYLLLAVLPRLEGRNILMDVPRPNVAGNRLTAKYGFRMQREFCRMYLGDNRYPGCPDHNYATSGAEKG